MVKTCVWLGANLRSADEPPFWSPVGVVGGSFVEPSALASGLFVWLFSSLLAPMGLSHRTNDCLATR